MKLPNKIIGLTIVALCVQACWFDKSTPNYVYMPNMYFSEAYEPYAKAERPYDDKKNTVSAFKNGMTALLPPENTVVRREDGLLPYELKDNEEDYRRSKLITNTPLDPKNKEKDLKRGKELFDIYCAICHGVNGDGQGNLVQRDKFSGVPNYKDREITAGSIYHVIMYGRNMMGAHASQLTEVQRWQVSAYVMDAFKKDQIKE